MRDFWTFLIQLQNSFQEDIDESWLATNIEFYPKIAGFKDCTLFTRIGNDLWTARTNEF